MFVKLKLSPQLQEEFVEINANRETPKIDTLATMISQIISTQQLIGYDGQKRIIIPLYQIIRIYTETKQVFCQTLSGCYKIHYRIYELITLLPQKLFIQISSSEIVNVTQIKDFALSKTGIYQVELLNNSITFTSRRYAQKIRKEFLK